MTDKMKTVCVGRFLIDMPEEAQVELGQANIDGFNISAFNETDEDFQKRVGDRESQLRATPDRLGGNKNLESARDVITDAGLVGKIFMHSRTVDEGTQGNGKGGVERYRHEGISTEALVHGQGISIDLFFENRALAWIEDLPRLVNQLVANRDNSVPAEPGFCMDRAYARDPLGAEQREQIMMFARLPSHPDIEFMLILSAGLKPDRHGLLARTDAADEGLSLAERMRITRLRAAPREVGGLAGEELAELVIEENEARVHSFWWEVNGTEDNVFVPHLVFKMTTGNGNRKPVPSSMSDGAALGLWERVITSLRVRPTGDRKLEVSSLPAAQIGACAMAGERCPQSGWWVCGEGKNMNVLGGPRQFVRHGERMPQALLLPPQTLWEKLRGLQPSYESTTPTSWRLADRRERQRVLPGLPLAPAPQGDPHPYEGTAAVSVGSRHATGEACTASGWWRCEEASAVDGTRWFAHGSVFPPATIAVPGGAFNKSPGAPGVIQRRAFWRLVRLTQSP